MADRFTNAMTLLMSQFKLKGSRSDAAFFAANVVAGPWLGTMGLIAVASFLFGQPMLIPALSGDLLVQAVDHTYRFGFVPAVLHACLMLLLSRTLQNTVAWVAAVPVSGVFTCVMYLKALDSFGVQLDLNAFTMPISAFFASVGCLLLCGALGWLPVIGAWRRDS